MIKPQWYVNCSEISKPMIDAVKNKELKIIPVEEEETWYRWIGGLRDWCISRQLWWGHRIPAYLVYKKGDPKPDSSLSSKNWVAAKNIEEAYKKASEKLNLPRE
jgi:valyl-tRNA synthetase